MLNVYELMILLFEVIRDYNKIHRVVIRTDTIHNYFDCMIPEVINKNHQIENNNNNTDKEVVVKNRGGGKAL